MNRNIFDVANCVRIGNYRSQRKRRLLESLCLGCADAAYTDIRSMLKMLPHGSMVQRCVSLSAVDFLALHVKSRPCTGRGNTLFLFHADSLDLNQSTRKTACPPERQPIGMYVVAAEEAQMESAEQARRHGELSAKLPNTHLPFRVAHMQIKR